jgi:anti-sigma factor RsiW
VSVSCEKFRATLPGYLEDSLDAPERHEFRDHLASCPGCRDGFASVEPSLLFARVTPDEVSDGDVAKVLAGVRAGIALAETEKRAGSARRGSRRRVAAVAASAALAAMTLLVPGSGRRPADAVATPVVASAPAPATVFPAGRGFSPASEKAPATTFPADATIYDWNPGAASEEPRVVWIVDRSIDI